MSRGDWHPDWIVPQWPVPGSVHAVFTTRHGGVSQAPFDTLNLGRPSDDDAQAVRRNRDRLHAALGPEPIYLSQVHGCRSVELSGPSEPGAIEADACCTRTAGVVCTIRVADCLPVLLAHAGGRVVAAAHAGWRGLAEGVLEENFAQYRSLATEPGTAAGAGGTVAADTVAWLGPCIGPQAFEVGPEVRTAFLARDPGADAMFRPGKPGKWFADLAGLARMRLRALGITRIHGNDSSPPWCTVGDPSRFFSHRRDSVALGGSGRMAACIWFD
ncbi:MAG: peptidoglycan editing factor PgeF [Burkholderiaceae bacterium]|nr:peptidoglycan editing factor PgeF [Rhodoferax sp.]MCB2005137.1 peptidoglycan editing factor PgeF [Rhodoferax sp.]MCB2029937.1 peptidoglycan editing factor PgeF [Rhodoferax sp.]MCB2040514.1 peptidoglycan editing factor PgeF [Rhodoferax sp.]MCP5260416.1 peptidoglycan editing factor PgeF [Rhodoferax sp.]